jgi:hypothetical protein
MDSMAKKQKPKKQEKRTRATAPKVERAAYTIPEFCAAYRVGRAKFYEMVKAGRGPRCKRDGKWVIVTTVEAEAWAARRDDPPAAGGGVS